MFGRFPSWSGGTGIDGVNRFGRGRGFFGGGGFFGGVPYLYPPVVSYPYPAEPSNVIVAPVGTAAPVVITPQEVPAPERIVEVRTYEPRKPSANPPQEPAAAPTPAPEEMTASEEYPALVAIRGRGLYSASRYWAAGNTFHLITTQGDHIQVPSTLLERVYPPRVSRASAPKTPRAR